MNLSEREIRPHEKYGYSAQFGRANVQVKCPFCFHTVTAYVWSLAGGGKKCKCGALHGSFGMTFAPIIKTKKR